MRDAAAAYQTALLWKLTDNEAYVTANLAQMAYSLYEQNKLNPYATKLDFFSANDNALLKLGEYVALSNLRSGCFLGLSNV